VKGAASKQEQLYFVLNVVEMQDEV